MGIGIDVLIRIVLVVGAAYFGICLLLYLLQDRMMFFPRPLGQEPVGAHVEPVAVERGDVTLRGWVVNRASEGPLLFYFSGNAEEVSDLTGLFARLDAVTVLVNYRGYGTSGGRPTAADVIDDAAAVVAELRRRLGGERPVILFGRSLGSGIAALTARSTEVDGIILMSPYRSIEAIARRRYPFAPVGWLLKQDIDATLAFDALPERVLILHARRDHVVPDRESRAFLEILPTEPEVVEFIGPHNIALETPELWAAIAAFVEFNSGN